MVTKRIFLGDTEETLLLCGDRDTNLKALEKRFSVQIFAQSSTLAIRGNPRKVDQTIGALEELKKQVRTARMEQLPIPSHPFGESDSIFTTANGKTIRALTPQQKQYVQAMDGADIVLSFGPAGTGKTFLAVVAALNALHSGRVQRIILTRPVVEAGEKLGFLPGDLHEKVNPYLRPLYDAFHWLLSPERFRIYRDDETIEIVPLAYMRGRTLENCFIILDEAQNTTSAQMKMFLTRMGNNSKIVATGDVTQIDLEGKEKSGFAESLRILKHVHEIRIIRFTEQDVVRHPLVKKILRAYDSAEGRSGEHS